MTVEDVGDLPYPSQQPRIPMKRCLHNFLVWSLSFTLVALTWTSPAQQAQTGMTLSVSITSGGVTVSRSADIDQEQLDAILLHTGKWNNGTGTSHGADRLMEDVLVPWLRVRVDANLKARADTITKASQELTYEQRLQLIQRIQESIQNAKK